MAIASLILDKEKPMKIVFARHGESKADVAQIVADRAGTYGLTARGYTQSAALAAQLTTRNIAAIYASPGRCAEQTAQIIGDRLGLSVQTTPALREFDCGIMEGRSDIEAWKEHNLIMAAWDSGRYSQSIKGGENFKDLKARFVPFLESIIKSGTRTDTNYLLISHAGILHHMLPLVLQNIYITTERDYPLDYCACVVAQEENQQLICQEWADRDNLAMLQMYRY